jgi:hypothetical protein
MRIEKEARLDFSALNTQAPKAIESSSIVFQAMPDSGGWALSDAHA